LLFMPKKLICFTLLCVCVRARMCVHVMK
jgi:hypothetical protein